MRELAETRRQLGQVLDVIDGQVPGDAQRETLRQALADAIWHQAQRGTASRADAYLAVARDLGIEMAGQAPAPDGTQRDILRQALLDAIDYRADVAGSQCKDCDQHPAGLCEDHTTDVVLFEAYRQLARDLGIEVQR